MDGLELQAVQCTDPTNLDFFFYLKFPIVLQTRSGYGFSKESGRIQLIQIWNTATEEIHNNGENKKAKFSHFLANQIWIRIQQRVWSDTVNPDLEHFNGK
jgi:hypothetical protein